MLEQLNDFCQTAHNDALFEVVQAIAKHVGITQIDGLLIREFFQRRQRQILEQLVADYADTFPAMASQMKVALEKFEASRGHQPDLMQAERFNCRLSGIREGLEPPPVVNLGNFVPPFP